MLLKSFQQEFILVWNNGQSWKDTGLTIIELCDLSIEFVKIHNQFNLLRLVKGPGQTHLNIDEPESG